MIIAIDGTAASGKGTLAKRIAAHYGFAHLDTGSLYRAVAYRVLERGLSAPEEEEAAALAQSLDLGSIDSSVLRTPDVSRMSSVVAAFDKVRAALIEQQRGFASSPPGELKGAVLDGRDIGTVICPDADLKLFIDAKLEERARRRWLEAQSLGSMDGRSQEQVLEDLRERDKRDMSRPVAPLVQADDAYLLDTTDLGIEAAFEAACKIVDHVLGPYL